MRKSLSYERSAKGVNRKMKYIPKIFKERMPEWKRKKDPVAARYIHRPVSFVFSSIFVEIGLTPNQVSFISLIIAFVTCILFLSTNTTILWIAFILINFWSITDSADGNMARLLGGKPFGDFIDATSSYFLVGFMFTCIGYSVYHTGGAIFQAGNSLILLLGAFSSSFDTMTRLFFQKMKNNAYEIRMDEMRNGIVDNFDITDRMQSRIGKLQNKIDGEFCSGGTVNLILLAACIALHMLDVFIVVYFFYLGLTFLASVVYLIKKTHCLKR